MIVGNIRLTSFGVRTLVKRFVSNLIGMMRNARILYGLISVSVTLMFTQGHSVTEKLELEQAFCCTVA